MIKDKSRRIQQSRKAALIQLHSFGWTYIASKKLSPESSSCERESLRDVVLVKRLEAAIKRINPWINDENCHNVIETIEGRLIKKVARYQQFRAVNKVILRLKQGQDRKAKSGVVWHTQGSGKSLSAKLKKYKLVFITDRTQLDQQLLSTFKGAQNETVYNAESVAPLRQLLQKDSSDLVTATVQNFQEVQKEAEQKNGNRFIDLNTSDKIIVLADEAHRTQFGRTGDDHQCRIAKRTENRFHRPPPPFINNPENGQRFWWVY